MKTELNWYQEWNDLQNIERILRNNKSLSEQSRKNYLQKIIKEQNILFQTSIGKTFLKEYRVVILQSLDVFLDEFLEDVTMMKKIIKMGIYSEEDIWEKVFFALEKKQRIRFYTSLGDAFLKQYSDKLKLMKDSEYQKLQYDLKCVQKIYEMVDFTDTEKARKITLFLTEKKDSIFLTWLGHGFLESLQNQYFSDEKKKNRAIRTSMKAIVYVLLCIIISFGSIGLYVKAHSAKKYNELQQKKTAAEEIKGGVENTETLEEERKEELEVKPEVLKEYQEIASEFPDFAGWLTISGTQIDYPVMQSLEEGYYLKRDYTGEAAAEGSLFADGKSSLYPLDNVLVLYGHNVKNGSMFGSLDKYENKAYLEQHKTIQFDTRYEKRAYVITAVLKTRVLYEEEEGFRYYQTFGYENETQFLQLVSFIEENALYDTGQKLNYGDEILMLSTCEYSQENGRLVIVAKRQKEG